MNTIIKKGIVIKSTGSNYLVRQLTGEDKKTYSCRLKGKLKLKGVSYTNPVIVGDKVLLEMDSTEIDVSIKEVLPRNNYIIRKSINLSKQEHIIAANMDQALLLITLEYPHTPYGFIDRFLITAGAYHIPVDLFVNKEDLYDSVLLEKYQEMKEIYENAGYHIHLFSSKESIGLDQVFEFIKAKITLVCGFSGTGKTTLLNALKPGLNLKTAEISDYHQKGVHTTTFAEMFEISTDTWLIDTPGIRELGLIDIEKNELSHYFPEINKWISQCKFTDCLHVNEPGCAVLKAQIDGFISDQRYESYVKILNDL